MMHIGPSTLYMEFSTITSILRSHINTFEMVHLYKFYLRIATPIHIESKDDERSSDSRANLTYTA